MDDSKLMQDTSQSQIVSPLIPPRTRYQFPFPSPIERLFAPFDDLFISVCQRRTDGLIHLFSLTLTFFTSIEFLLAAPPTLYALGYDSAAGLCSSVLFVLGVISQIPKKFIYRLRPWMVGRALPIRQDKTSSFPSRAVACAVVFTWLAAWSIEMQGLLNRPLSPVLLWLCIICAAALTAVARINVGAHYPSDTVLGFVLGCLVIFLGTKLEAWWCTMCQPMTSHPVEDAFILRTWSQVLKRSSYLSLSRVTVISYALTLISIQGFWVKCSYVYGLLLSSMAFRFTYVCADRGRGLTQIAGVSKVLTHGSFREHVQASLVMYIMLFCGMLTRGRKGMFRVVIFSFIYFGTLALMLSWRLRLREVVET